MTKSEQLEEENSGKNKKYQGKDIFIIENGKLQKITHKEIKENDYIIEKDDLVIIDRDKKILRPYVEDLLRQMNIETLQVKLLKMLTLFSIVSIFLCVIFSFLTYSSSSKITKLYDQFVKINRIEYMQPIRQPEQNQKILNNTGTINNSITDI